MLKGLGYQQIDLGKSSFYESKANKVQRNEVVTAHRATSEASHEETNDEYFVVVV